jgi:uncharacterized membrane protein
VLTGLFAWLAALPVRSHGGFFLMNVLMLTPFGLGAAWLLAKMSGRRALWFAAAPAVVLYGFINWDMFSVGLAVGGMYLWSRQRPYLAATVFALGACAKLWPGLFLVALVADELSKRRTRRAVHVGLIGAVTGLAVNLPFVLLNARGWYAPFAFQAAVRIDAPGSTIWDWDGKFLSTPTVNALSWALTIIGVVVLVAVGWRRSEREGTFPFLQTAAAMVFWYLLMSKDNSPQYILWVLPFFALLRLKTQIWVQLAAIGVVSYLFFFNVLVGKVLFVVGAWQAAVFMVAMVAALGSRTVFEVPAEPREPSVAAGMPQFVQA